MAVEPLREKIAKAIRRLPGDLQAAAEADLSWVENHLKPAELSLQVLEGLLLDSSAPPRARAFAAWVAGLLDEESLAPLLEAILHTGPPQVVLWEAAKSLCTLERGGPLFRQLLIRSSDADLRCASAYALGNLRDLSAAEDLEHVLDSASETPAVKGQAAEALGYLALKRSLPSLLRASNDSSPEVRLWAAFALGQIGGREAESKLRQMADSDHEQVQDWGSVGTEAAAALDALRSSKQSRGRPGG